MLKKYGKYIYIYMEEKSILSFFLIFVMDHGENKYTKEKVSWMRESKEKEERKKIFLHTIC